MRVLVTGGSGFIGRHVVARLMARGDTVRVVDLVAHPDPAVDCLVGDVRDRATVDRALDGGFDGIVHLAAIPSVLLSVNDPHAVFETNVGATETLLEACRDGGAHHFVFASTNAVVGNVGDRTIDEQIPIRPLTPYGATKAASEMLMSAYGACYDLATVVLRFTNVYGVGMHVKDTIIPRMLRAALSGDPIRIYGDGEQRRDYVYVTDAAQSIEVGLGLDVPDTLTIGGGESLSVNALYDVCCAVTGITIKAENVPAPSGEMPAVIVDTTHARSLGFDPAVEINDGVKATWEDFSTRT